MSIVQSLEVPTDRIAEIRRLIPVGVEHYVRRERGFSYINLLTDDHQLVRRMTTVIRMP